MLFRSDCCCDWWSQQDAIKSRLLENTGYSEQDVEELLRAMCFSKRPNFVNYLKFYSLNIDPAAKRLWYPFTQIYIYPNLFTDYECDKLMDLTDALVRPSTVANPTDDNISTDYRTSKTADLNWALHPFVNYIDNKIGKALGINPFLGEIMQVQKYNPGQIGRAHV